LQKASSKKQVPYKEKPLVAHAPCYSTNAP